MKLKHRLSLYSIVIFSIIIVIVSMTVYFSFYNQMEKKELQSLENKTLLAAVYYLEQDELPALEHENIKSQLLKTISRRHIVVYDESDRKFSGDMYFDKNISSTFIESVRQKRNDFITTEQYFYHGTYYNDNQPDIVVIDREAKNEFNEQMQSLLHILFFVSVAGLILIYFFSHYLGYIAYQPISKI